jgi:tRNA(Arg) A34 adenosine deaminase TadA
MEHHERYISRCIELSYQAREQGNAPFAALLVLDGQIVLEATNRMAIDKHPLSHSELNLLLEAGRRFSREELGRAVLYANAEPCLMCCGAMLHTGIRHMVYASTQVALQKFAPGYPYIPSQEVFSRLGVEIKLEGNLLGEEALKAHEGFW